MSWIIYKHTSPSGNIYIGQTKQDDPQKRWQYGNGYRNNTVFYSAIKKYGWNNIQHEIIESNISTQEEANAKEIYWISYYNSYKNGYNMTPGGNQHGECTGKAVCQIDIKTCKVIATYVSESDAERVTKILGRNIAAVCLKQGQLTAGGYYWCFADDIQSFSPPTSQRNKSRQQPVYCYEMDRIFESIQDAHNITGIGSDGICAVCNGNRGGQYTAGGLHWCFLKDKEEFVLHTNIKKVTERERLASRRKATNAVMVVQIDIRSLNVIASYPSISAAEKETGISRQQIGKSVKGMYISAGKYYWCRKEDYYEGWRPLNYERGFGHRIYKEKRKEIYCITTQTKYDSLNDVVNATGLTASSISQCCRKKLNQTGNMEFCYWKEWINGTYVKRENKQNKNIVCLETGELFSSIKEAAIRYNLHSSNIVNCLEHKQRTSGGYHWRYHDEYDKNEKIQKQRLSMMKKVLCVEPGKEYLSIREASLKTGINEQNIGRACKNPNQTAGKYHWRYI